MGELDWFDGAGYVSLDIPGLSVSKIALRA